MRLIEEQIEHYFRDGYVIVRELVSLEKLKPVQDKARSLVTADANYQPHIFDLEDPESNDPVVHSLFLDLAVIEAVEQIFDGPARAYYGFLALLDRKSVV